MTNKVTRLKNGMRVVTEEMDGVLSASVGIYVARGARHEREDQNGIAHFLEHMAFKGTTSRSALEIVEQIEDRGGMMNAYTSKELTAYYTRSLAEDVPLSLDILSDIVLHSSFDAKEIETERGVILQEIGMYNDMPEAMVFQWLEEESYPDQALGRPILGSPERVSGFGADDFREFVSAQYGAENLIISASGKVDHDEIVSQAEAAFSQIDFASGKGSEPARFATGMKRVEKPLEQAHFALGLQAPGLDDEKYYTASLLANILGGGMSSRLFQNVREKRGLCYEIYASLSSKTEAGQLVIYAGTSSEGVDELMGAVSTELRRFGESVGAAELERANAQMRAGSVMGLENVESRMERSGRQMVYFDKVIPIEESLAKIEAVSLEDVSTLADAMLLQAPQMVLYGPIGKARDFDGYMSGLS